MHMRACRCACIDINFSQIHALRLTSTIKVSNATAITLNNTAVHVSLIGFLRSTALRLTFNTVSPAPWDAKLGYQRKPLSFRPLHLINPKGGPVPCTVVVVQVCLCSCVCLCVCVLFCVRGYVCECMCAKLCMHVCTFRHMSVRTPLHML
jgi:hypothetical protein